jgi:hypothetical protein
MASRQGDVPFVHWQPCGDVPRARFALAAAAT